MSYINDLVYYTLFLLGEFDVVSGSQAHYVPIQLRENFVISPQYS